MVGPKPLDAQTWRRHPEVVPVLEHMDSSPIGALDGLSFGTFGEREHASNCEGLDVVSP